MISKSYSALNWFCPLQPFGKFTPPCQPIRLSKIITQSFAFFFSQSMAACLLLLSFQCQLVRFSFIPFG